MIFQLLQKTLVQPPLMRRLLADEHKARLDLRQNKAVMYLEQLPLALFAYFLFLYLKVILFVHAVLYRRLALADLVQRIPVARDTVFPRGGIPQEGYFPFAFLFAGEGVEIGVEGDGWRNDLLERFWRDEVPDAVFLVEIQRGRNIVFTQRP